MGTVHEYGFGTHVPYRPYPCIVPVPYLYRTLRKIFGPANIRNSKKCFLSFFLHFCCICFCIWVCHFGFVLSFFVISLSFLCHFVVICLSFVCHLIDILLSFSKRENGEAQLLKKMTTMDHDRPFVISWQHQMEGTSAKSLGKPAGGEEG